MSKTALIIVDIQNDFCPGGALAVPNGDQVIAPLNKLVSALSPFPREKGWLIVASRDWHPDTHCSFKEQGGLWPAHCVQNTEGACLHRDLNISPLNSLVFDKAFERDKDSYSAFGGSIFLGGNLLGFRFTLEEILRKAGVEEVYIGGLATDYCVKATAVDAAQKGFKTYLLTDACKAVNVRPGDDVRALSEMANAGVEFTTTDEVIQGAA